MSDHDTRRAVGRMVANHRTALQDRKDARLLADGCVGWLILLAAGLLVAWLLAGCAAEPPAPLTTAQNNCLGLDLVMTVRADERQAVTLRVTNRGDAPASVAPGDFLLYDDAGASHTPDGEALRLRPGEAEPAQLWVDLPAPRELRAARLEAAPCPALSVRWP